MSYIQLVFLKVALINELYSASIFKGSIDKRVIFRYYFSILKQNKLDDSGLKSSFENCDWYETSSGNFSLSVNQSVISVVKYRAIRNDCRGFNNLSYTVHLRQEYMYFFI